MPVPFCSCCRRSPFFFSDHTTTKEDCSILFVPLAFSSKENNSVLSVSSSICSHSPPTTRRQKKMVPFILCRLHNYGRGRFRSGRVVVVLLSSSATTRRRIRPVPFWSRRRHSPFSFKAPDEDGRAPFASSVSPLSLNASHEDE